jgi:hypothetical protein
MFPLTDCANIQVNINFNPPSRICLLLSACKIELHFCFPFSFDSFESVCFIMTWYDLFLTCGIDQACRWETGENEEKDLIGDIAQALRSVLADRWHWCTSHLHFDTRLFFLFTCVFGKRLDSLRLARRARIRVEKTVFEITSNMPVLYLYCTLILWKRTH